VAINARAAVRREVGGVERVAQVMARELPLVRPERYRVIEPPRGLAHRAGQAWEQGLLPLLARGAALIYSPATLAPVASGRNVVVIHDVAALRHPAWYSPTFVAWQRALLPAIARRARAVITVSEFSRRELVEVLGPDPRDVHVVPLGVDERFSPQADAEGASRRLGLGPRPYALAVGSQIARKNLGVLRLAARRLAGAGVELVTAGSGRGYMRAGGRAPGRPLGYVPDELLPGLYAGARALVLPSLYEGFGLPCLEAMASGTPVVASDRTALPEVCGEAALLVDPEDEDAVATALVAAASDQALRERLTVAGLDHASRYRWRRTAELTDRVMSELLGAH